MIAIWAVPVLLSTPSPQAPQEELQRLQALEAAQKWVELADAFEALKPADRGRFLGSWLRALEKAERWARLQQVCEAVIPQFEAKSPGIAKDLQKQRIKALTRQGDHALAALACEQLGDSGETYFFVLGTDSARTARDWETLERLGGKLLAKNPKDPIGLAVRGEGLARMDRFKEAEPILQLAVPANPRDGWVLVNLSRCLNDRKAWAESLEACDRALGLDPKLVEARYNRGRACFELARYQEARDDFQAALSLLPGDPVLLENLRQAQRYLDVTTKPKKNKK